MAATIGSETTAAQAGEQGVLRRDPFAMLSFCGYNMADYFGHCLAMGERLRARGAQLPRIFSVNWFRTDDAGQFKWPGFGQNMRVLRWMVERVEGEAQGVEHALGISPRYEDIDWNGLAYERAVFEEVTRFDTAAWRQELRLHSELFARFDDLIPEDLLAIRADLPARLDGALMAK